ncbi:hypothetical protein GE061_013265 [Apolygus lucorum]|uniref:Peptidase S8 pro-domain domain-containing protein n=1 Tax=Apolygus lucorum TaxID=248454 RepID=A0A8S9XMJ1_APOLU|nr:hypothetical protein GE061_013265 [Apolygus lucorum]
MFWLWAPLLVIVEVTAHYTPQWAAHIEGGPELAQRIVEGHGFRLLAEIFPDTYHLEHSRVAKRSATPSRYHNDRLTSNKQVVWARQLRVKRRVKRDLLTRRELGLSAEHVLLNDPKWPQMWYLLEKYEKLMPYTPGTRFGEEVGFVYQLNFLDRDEMNVQLAQNFK